MIPPESRDRLVLISIGFLVLLAPALILVITLGTLVLFFVLAYGVYRLTLWLVKRQVPVTLESLDSREATDPSDDDPTSPEDR